MSLANFFPGRTVVLGAVMALTAQPAAAATLHDLAGGEDPSTNRVRIVFLSEGYTQQQLEKFVTDASTTLDNLLAQAPFYEYRNLFSAHAIAVASPQSGSDHPAYGVTRSTYFNSTFDNSDRIITVPLGANGQGKIDELVRDFVPTADVKVLLVNDPVPGGSDGFGYTVIASASSASLDMLVHEFGHVVGGLGDEYESGIPSLLDVEQANTTRETRREFIKWKAWIAPETPIPTPPTFDFMDVVGLFEGAKYQPTGWYRPELDCKMRSLAVPFCDVCTEALVLGIYGLIRPIESYSPAITSFPLEPGRTTSFSVQTIRPGTDDLYIRWLTNGVVAAEGVTNLTLSSTALNAGGNAVVAEVIDLTPLVRTDLEGRLAQTVQWTIINGAVAPALQLEQWSFSDGNLVFLVTGADGRSYALQHSTDLANWTSLSSHVVAPAGTWHTNQLSGFYRAQAIASGVASP
jgi:hypothetical protein